MDFNVRVHTCLVLVANVDHLRRDGCPKMVFVRETSIPSRSPARMNYHPNHPCQHRCRATVARSFAVDGGKRVGTRQAPKNRPTTRGELRRTQCHARVSYIVVRCSVGWCCILAIHFEQFLQWHISVLGRENVMAPCRLDFVRTACRSSSSFCSSLLLSRSSSSIVCSSSSSSSAY